MAGAAGAVILVRRDLEGARAGFRGGSTTVSREQIGHWVVRRLWRQKRDTVVSLVAGRGALDCHHSGDGHGGGL